MNQFKVGDMIRNVRSDTFNKGDVVNVSKLKDAEGDRETIEVTGYGKGNQHVYEDHFEKYVPKKPTHLVVWEESGDPCKFFDSKDKADDFTKELSEKPNVKEDSIVLVEIKSAKKITIRKYLRTSDYKI